MTRRKDRNVAVSKSSAVKRTETPPKNPVAVTKKGRPKKGKSLSDSRVRAVTLNTASDYRPLSDYRPTVSYCWTYRLLTVSVP